MEKCPTLGSAVGGLRRIGFDIHPRWSERFDHRQVLGQLDPSLAGTNHKFSDRPGRSELGLTVPLDTPTGDGETGPELHDAETVGEDDERRVRAWDVGPEIGLYVTQLPYHRDQGIQRVVDEEQVVLH
jgi:hypothetical protein